MHRDKKTSVLVPTYHYSAPPGSTITHPAGARRPFRVASNPWETSHTAGGDVRPRSVARSLSHPPQRQRVQASADDHEFQPHQRHNGPVQLSPSLSCLPAQHRYPQHQPGVALVSVLHGAGTPFHAWPTPPSVGNRNRPAFVAAPDTGFRSPHHAVSTMATPMFVGSGYNPAPVGLSRQISQEETVRVAQGAHRSYVMDASETDGGNPRLRHFQHFHIEGDGARRSKAAKLGFNDAEGETWYTQECRRSAEIQVVSADGKVLQGFYVDHRPLGGATAGCERTPAATHSASSRTAGPFEHIPVRKTNGGHDRSGHEDQRQHQFQHQHQRQYQQPHSANLPDVYDQMSDGARRIDVTGNSTTGGVLGADVAAGHASGPATVVGGRSTPLYRKLCEIPGCQVQPSYGVRGTSKPRFCAGHKKKGMVGLKNRPCLFPGCLTRPHYGLSRGRPVYCTTHKTDGMVHLLKEAKTRGKEAQDLSQDEESKDATTGTPRKRRPWTVVSKPSQNNTDDKGSAKMKGAKEHARTPAEDVTGRPSATSPIAKKDGKSSKGTITGSLTTNEKGGGGATVERSPTSRTSTLQRTASSISSSGSTSETSPTQQEEPGRKESASIVADAAAAATALTPTKKAEGMSAGKRPDSPEGLSSVHLGAVPRGVASSTEIGDAADGTNIVVPNGRRPKARGTMIKDDKCLARNEVDLGRSDEETSRGPNAKRQRKLAPAEDIKQEASSPPNAGVVGWISAEARQIYKSKPARCDADDDAAGATDGGSAGIAGRKGKSEFPSVKHTDEKPGSTSPAEIVDVAPDSKRGRSKGDEDEDDSATNICESLEISSKRSRGREEGRGDSTEKSATNDRRRNTARKSVCEFLSCRKAATFGVNGTVRYCKNHRLFGMQEVVDLL